MIIEIYIDLGYIKKIQVLIFFFLRYIRCRYESRFIIEGIKIKIIFRNKR